MKSNLVSASVLAVSALAFFGSASSFAEGRDPFPQDQVNTVSTKTRADVRAELRASPARRLFREHRPDLPGRLSGARQHQKPR
jgi:hypothetical protein